MAVFAGHTELSGGTFSGPEKTQAVALTAFGTNTDNQRFGRLRSFFIQQVIIYSRLHDAVVYSTYMRVSFKSCLHFRGF